MMVTLGVVLIVGQVAVILLLRRFVRAVEGFTAVYVQSHNASVAIHERQEAITAHLRRIDLRRGEQEP